MEKEFARVRALEFEPYTLFRVRTMAGPNVNVSEYGCRAGKRENAWPPDATHTNVFVFGGSTAFGYGIADGETIPAQLGEILTDLMPTKRVSVYNFATPNFICVQERIQLEQLLIAGYLPRIVVFLL